MIPSLGEPSAVVGPQRANSHVNPKNSCCRLLDVSVLGGEPMLKGAMLTL